MMKQTVAFRNFANARKSTKVPPNKIPENATVWQTGEAVRAVGTMLPTHRHIINLVYSEQLD